ncbi:class I SAM-dependent methyltransferase [Bacteriovoracaceae bacterium]|nr:class I SAM-dependent methyltransferase [Bacteriovoracaceae bacterium]
MITTASFWDKVSLKYSKKAVPNENIYQEKLKRTQELFPKDAQVLEFGCGTGTTSLIHAPFVKQIQAYDYSPGMIQIANEKKVQQSINNVSFDIKAVDDISFKKNNYDVIMAHSILHLTENNLEILKKVHSSLKSGGYFVSSSGCLKDMNFLIRAVLPFLKAIGKAPFVNQFSAQELIQLHEEVGFKNLKPWHYQKGELFLIAQK